MQADNPTSRGISWYAEPTVPAPERPRLTFDLDVDVCVIGGGLAGLTAAREIARRGWSVALLEAQTVGFGASGRNVGFVIPGFQEDADRIVERAGIDRARQLWALSERGVEYVRETIRETGMPGVEPVPGWLFVSKFRDDPKLTDDAILMWEKFGALVELWPREQVRDVLKSRLYHNAMHFPRAFHIHPLNYTLGLAAAAEAAGVRIFEHTPALSLDPSGIRKRVGTPSARVRSAQVVLAGNNGLDGLMPRLSASLLPVTSFVAVTEHLGDKLHEAIAFKGGVSDSDTVDSHYRIVDGDRLLWCGGQWMWGTDPKRYVHRIAGDIQRAYPQLGRIAVEHIWAGAASVAVHRMPQIGEVARGVWIANGFAGHGFNTTAMAGELIGRGIAETDETWRLFSPYDLVWAGGSFGKAALQVRYWVHRLRERLNGSLLGAPNMVQESMPREPGAEAPPVEAVTLGASPVEAAPPLPADTATVTAATAAEQGGAEASPAPVEAAPEAVKKPGRRPAKKAAGSAKPKATKARKSAKQAPVPPEDPMPGDNVTAENQ